MEEKEKSSHTCCQTKNEEKSERARRGAPRGRSPRERVPALNETNGRRVRHQCFPAALWGTGEGNYLFPPVHMVVGERKTTERNIIVLGGNNMEISETYPSAGG